MVVARRLDYHLVTPLRWQCLLFDWTGCDALKCGKGILDDARAPAAFIEIGTGKDKRGSLAHAAGAERALRIVSRQFVWPRRPHHALMIPGTAMPGGSNDGRSAGQRVMAQLAHSYPILFKLVSSVMRIDFGRTALDYATHRAGFPDLLFDRLGALGLRIMNAQVLDLGTGTGALARGFARRGARAIGIDTAESMLEQARRLDREEGLAVDYRLTRAEDTGLASGTFLIVAAGQCWHWFERPCATAEAFRLLAPGGHLVIAYLDWLPLRDSVVEITESLILKHNPGWQMAGGTGMHPEHLPGLSEGGFRGIETFSVDIDIPYTHEAWRGRIRASAGVAASLAEDAVARFDQEHAAILKSRFPMEPLQVPHRVWAAVAIKPYIRCGHARLAST